MGKKQKKKKKHNIAWADKPLHVLTNTSSNISLPYTIMPSDEYLLKGKSYCAGMYDTHNPQNDTALTKAFKSFKETHDDVDTVKIKEIAENIMNDYISKIDDIDPRINCYTHNSNIDSFDFREYNTNGSHDDILTEAYAIISQTPDISLLFAPSEIFDIKLINSVTIRVIRKTYDSENERVSYQTAEYTDFCLSDNTLIKVPSLIQCFDTDIVTVVDGKISKSNESYKNTTYDKLGVSLATISSIQNANKDSSRFHITRTQLLGSCTIKNVIKCIEQDRLKLHDGSKLFITETLRMIHSLEYGLQYDNKANLREYTVDNQYDIHNIASTAFTLACIIIANNFLRQKKLSKPIASTKQTINRKAEIILENRPERKTRMLGPYIKITTEKRPSVITKEKLIKYHTPEWACKGYLRRLKDGRTIEVKPSVHKRRCVDLSNVIDNRPKQAIDYIIKSDDIEEEK